ncbi:hypothetical protein PLICRDRAFT_54168 [Plicaturopsis crispa FD-325 SS-3]|nr:hypothetical protein PLICRDRAFT_54168 [Plicaturopsis crispa FD-325 SS-3]
MILLTVREHACKLDTTHSREETVQYPDTVVPRERRHTRTNMDSSVLSGGAGTPGQYLECFKTIAGARRDGCGTARRDVGSLLKTSAPG